MEMINWLLTINSATVLIYASLIIQDSAIQSFPSSNIKDDEY